MSLIVQLTLFGLWKVVRRWYLFTGYALDLYCCSSSLAPPFLCAGLHSARADPRYPILIQH